MFTLFLEDDKTILDPQTRKVVFAQSKKPTMRAGFPYPRILRMKKQVHHPPTRMRYVHCTAVQLSLKKKKKEDDC